MHHTLATLSTNTLEAARAGHLLCLDADPSGIHHKAISEINTVLWERKWGCKAIGAPSGYPSDTVQAQAIIDMEDRNGWKYN